ncbi:MAG: hypothetical protein MOGMAGMI_01857 [Candidatus Omnitrophica bacterium]|nr:hypothetical protein [Candidatus Omnitrophota bacterium]
MAGTPGVSVSVFGPLPGLAAWGWSHPVRVPSGADATPDTDTGHDARDGGGDAGHVAADRDANVSTGPDTQADADAGALLLGRGAGDVHAGDTNADPDAVSDGGATGNAGAVSDSGSERDAPEAVLEGVTP